MDSYRATYKYNGDIRDKQEDAVLVLPSQNNLDEFAEELGKTLEEVAKYKVDFRLTGLEYLGPVFPADLVRKSVFEAAATANSP